MYPSLASIHLASLILLLTLSLINMGAGLCHRYVNRDRYSVCTIVALRVCRD